MSYFNDTTSCGILASNIEPVDIKVFFEDNIPYVHYIGKTEDMCGQEFQIEIPHMDMKLEPIYVYEDIDVDDILGDKSNSMRLVYDQVCWRRGNDPILFKQLKRKVSKQQLENELGYKLEITE